MKKFTSIKQAKDYLAGRIADEATREGVPLSETERKMLYFSETGWTLPDMAHVSADFDRDYDQNEYEKKIAGLVRQIRLRDHAQSQVDTESWAESVEKLSRGDHYLSVLISTTQASEPGLHGFLPTMDSGSARRPPHDVLKLFTTGLIIVSGSLILPVVGRRLFGPKFSEVAEWILDRNHSGLIVIFALVIGFGWHIRSDLKIIVKGLLNRP